MNLYGFEVWHLGVMVGINFFTQLLADIILTVIIDKIDYRLPIQIAQLFSALGLALFASVPFIFPREYVFVGFLLATMIFAFSGGMQEVLLSPMVDAFPDSKSKSFMMSVLHSFYAWGQMLSVIITAVYLAIVPHEYWYVIVYAWTVLPIVGLIIFTVCPMYKRNVVKSDQKKAILNPTMILCLLAIFLGGGTEIFANQYVSTFCVLALELPKHIADLIGMGLFAGLMGIGRVVFAKMSVKISMNKILIVTSFLTFIAYLIAGLSPVAVISLVSVIICGFTVAVLWPGVLVVAGEKFPTAGALIFALLAISGDIGGSVIPTVMGFVATGEGLSVAFTISAVVPFTCLVCHLLIAMLGKKDKKTNAQDAQKE